MTTRSTIIAAAFALTLTCCTSDDTTTAVSPTTGPTSPSTSSPPPTEPPITLPMIAGAFAEMPSVELPEGAAYAGPDRPRTLDEVRISPGAAGLMTPEVVATLERQGFVVIASDYKLFHQPYGLVHYESEGAVYLTTDALFHTWHLTFDKILRSLEAEVLLPKLETMVREVAADATAQRTDLEGTGMAAAAVTVDRLLQTEMALLGLATPSEDEVQRELKLIQQHAAVEESPILGTTIDYSSFTPRGHYTRTPSLTRFFLGMTLLGQVPFPLNEGLEPVRAAVLASRLFVPSGLGSAEVATAWHDVYETTSFMVGAADDYTPFEVSDALESVAPGAMRDPSSIGDATLEAARTALLNSRTIQIDTEEPSVRLMGVRFVLDSWILDQLVYPNVGTELDPRLMPSTLDVAAAFGSRFARRVQQDAGQFGYAGYGEQLEALTEAVAERPTQAWGSTVYDAWLWSIQPLWLPHGDTYPDLMRTEAWAAKDTQTGAGSYAELKHDTILYAKQFGAEGGNGAPSWIPRNWVEPEPVAYLRLAATVDMLLAGLDERDLLTSETSGLLSDLSRSLRWLAELSLDELAGEAISVADNEELQSIGSWLETMWWRTADQLGGGASSMDEEAAIVADVGRGGDEVLEVGTGRVDILLILTPNDEGVFQVAVGGVYSFYEFTQPVSERLDDETWRQMLSAGDAPERPAWEDVLFPS